MTGFSNTLFCVYEYAILRILIREVAYFKYAGITWAPLLSFFGVLGITGRDRRPGAVS